MGRGADRYTRSNDDAPAPRGRGIRKPTASAGLFVSHAGFFGVILSRGICGSPVRLRRREQPQILRLRARPTRKSRGSEILCGRFAQDDIFKFMNNPASAVGRLRVETE